MGEERSGCAKVAREVREGERESARAIRIRDGGGRWSLSLSEKTMKSVAFWEM